MPQGGIDEDEDPQQAALRELYEETGIKSVEMIAEAPDWIDYDLPTISSVSASRANTAANASAGSPCAFTGMKVKSASTRHQEGNQPEFDAWEWKPMHELPGMIVPFKRQAYDQVVKPSPIWQEAGHEADRSAGRSGLGSDMPVLPDDQ
jgi:putative (di)nucleoside polyphosphate hydrolase